MSPQLGNRIKYFRKRSGMSQLELETLIGTSSGSLSRIENGEVNPTKETLDKIASALRLTLKQIVYLNGLQSELVSNHEIENAKVEVSTYFKKRGVLAYLIDDRWRMLAVSDYFIKLFDFNEFQVRKLIGQSLIRIIVDDSLGIAPYLKGKDYEDLLKYQFSRFNQEIGFMQEDSIYKEALYYINKNNVAKKVWSHVNDNVITHTLDTAFATIYINGVNIKLRIIRQFIHKNPRFEIIEYIPANPLIRMFSKLK